jgi:hypothetical protein
LASLAAVLLSTLVIGSTSASSRGFSNGGNNIITDQNCTAGNLCNLSSSNVITGEPGSTNPPSPGLPTETKAILVNMVVINRGLPRLIITGAGHSLVTLNKPCNITNGVVRGEGVLTGVGIVHGSIELTCLVHPPAPAFEIGIRVNSPPFSTKFVTQDRQFDAVVNLSPSEVVRLSFYLLSS